LTSLFYEFYKRCKSIKTLSEMVTFVRIVEAIYYFPHRAGQIIMVYPDRLFIRKIHWGINPFSILSYNIFKLKLML